MELVDPKLPFIPEKFLFSFRINHNWVKRLNANGIVNKRLKRSKNLKEQAKASKNAGVDEATITRLDKAGAVRVDYGFPIFGDKGIKRVRASSLFQQLIDEGFKVTEVYLKQKSRDVMSFLVVVISKKDSVELSTGAVEIINRLLTNVYEHCYLFRNPDRSVTINLSHVIEFISPLSISMTPEGDFIASP